MAVKKYKFNGKEYDLDAVTKAVLSNWSGSDKDYQAATEILQSMKDDEKSYADLNKINFGSSYAAEKGMFGKDREKSKHYKRATGKIIKQFLAMDPYEEPVVEAPTKTKLGLGVLGNDLKGFIGSTEGLTDEYKKKAIREGYNRALAKYKWDQPDLYDIEEGYDLSTLKGYLDQGLESLDTDKYDDDNYYLSRFGINNVFKPSQQNADEEKLKADLQAAGVNMDHYNKIQQLVGLTKQLRDSGLDDSYISFLFQPLVDSLNSSNKVRTVSDSVDSQIPEFLSKEGASYFKNKVLPAFNNAYRSNNWDEWNKSGYENILLKVLEAQITGKSGELKNKYGYGLPTLTKRIYSPDNSNFYELIRNGNMAYGYHNGKLKGYDISMLGSELVQQLAEQQKEKDKGWNNSIYYRREKGGHLKLLRSYGN